MKQLICDLCGKPIKSMGECRTYKIKERIYSFHESWWTKIDAHEECVKKLYDTVKEKEGFKYVKVDKNKNKTEELGSCKYYEEIPKIKFIYNQFTGQCEGSYTIQQGCCMGTKNCEEVNCQGKKSKCETKGYCFLMD